MLVPFFEDFDTVREALYEKLGKPVEIYEGTADNANFVAGFILRSYMLEELEGQAALVLKGDSEFSCGVPLSASYGLFYLKTV